MVFGRCTDSRHLYILSIRTSKRHSAGERNESRLDRVCHQYRLASKKGLSPEEQKREYSKLLDDVQEMGMNAVIVQIKPAADAFYPSDYEALVRVSDRNTR